MTKTLREETGRSVDEVLQEQLRYALGEMEQKEKVAFEKQLEESSKPTLEKARKILRQARQRLEGRK